MNAQLVVARHDYRARVQHATGCVGEGSMDFLIDAAAAAFRDAVGRLPTDQDEAGAMCGSCHVCSGALPATIEPPVAALRLADVRGVAG